MTDLSISEQRSRANQRPPRVPDRVRVDGEEYVIVGDEERVDLPEHQLAERKALFDEHRRQIHQSLRARRKATPLFLRLKNTANRIARLQAARSRAIASSPGGGGTDNPLPSGGDSLAIAHVPAMEVRRLLRMVEKSVERLEDLLDGHEGVGLARDYAGMDTYEKNAVILTEFVGWSPAEIASFEPALGTARTIRYVRSVWAGEERVRWPGGAVRGVCGHRDGQCTDDCPKASGGRTKRNA